MKTCSRNRIVWMVLVATALLLAACGTPVSPQVQVVTATFTLEPQVVVVTATPTPELQVVVVTATPTPEPQVVVVTATFTPPPEVPPTDTLPPPPPPPIQPQATDTPPPPPPEPSATPDQVLTAQAILTAAAAQQPQPTATDTPVPRPPAATATPKPTAAPKVSLASYGVIYSNFDGGNEGDENKYNVWIMRGDGSEARKVIDKGFEPAFSPTGHKVAYYHCWTGIRIYDLDKKTEREVAPDPWAEFASFSPDGTRLVFHQWVGNWWSADVNLYIINTDGSGRTKLPAGMRPSWSPKGDLIVFDSCRDTSCGIFVVGVNGQGLRQVTQDGGGKASWSPDGKKIVYSAEVEGNPEIFVVNLDGSGKKQLTKNRGNDTLPVYSPDGQYIYFLSDQNGTAWAIRVMRPDGSDIKTIRKVGVPPRWQFSRLWVGWW